MRVPPRRIVTKRGSRSFGRIIPSTPSARICPTIALTRERSDAACCALRHVVLRSDALRKKQRHVASRVQCFVVRRFPNVYPNFYTPIYESFGGSHNSILFPSGSYIQANFPYSISSTLSSTFTPSSLRIFSSSSKFSTL